LEDALELQRRLEEQRSELKALRLQLQTATPTASANRVCKAPASPGSSSTGVQVQLPGEQLASDDDSAALGSIPVLPAAVEQPTTTTTTSPSMAVSLGPEPTESNNDGKDDDDDNDDGWGDDW